ncbi:MAG: hypothetical protein E8D41_03810 [Nitrospira sp.]|nr:MAG: hypothetical protein E8D41_03810 [Nitrospira sp.]
MASRTPITDRILDELQRMPVCDLDTLTKNLPDLSWSQIFLEIDRLSREGVILVTFGLERRYMLRLPEYKTKSAPRPAH